MGHPDFTEPCRICNGLGHLPSPANLREARIAGDYTLEEMVAAAKEAGLSTSQSELSEIETGSRGRRVSLRIVRIYAHALGWDLPAEEFVASVPR